MKVKRAYLDNGNGTASPTEFCFCSDGKPHVRPITAATGGIKPISYLRGKDRKVLSVSDLNQLNSLKMNQQNGLGIVYGEKADGTPFSGRVETYAKTGRSTHATFTFRNTSTTEQTIYLGDPVGLAALKNGSSALSGAVTVEGPWGASSLTYLSELVKSGIWMDLHGLKFIALSLTVSTPSSTSTPAAVSGEVGSEPLASTDLIYEGFVDPLIKTIDERPLNTFQGIMRDTTNPGIRDFEDFRKQLNPLSYMKIVLPSTKGIQLQTNLSAISDAAIMRKY